MRSARAVGCEVLPIWWVYHTSEKCIVRLATSLSTTCTNALGRVRNQWSSAGASDGWAPAAFLAQGVGSSPLRRADDEDFFGLTSR